MPNIGDMFVNTGHRVTSGLAGHFLGKLAPPCVSCQCVSVSVHVSILRAKIEELGGEAVKEGARCHSRDCCPNSPACSVATLPNLKNAD